MEADSEAVEAVSEILSRVAPGGVTVAPAFELVQEGLGARVDPSRPAVLRAYIHGADPGAGVRAVAEVRTALGHLQAFGLRPIGELQTSVVHEEDWADAWKEHFPVLRVGRRTVIKPTWREHESAPAEVVIELDPGMAFGTGLHPTTRLCLAQIEAWGDEGLVEGARVLDVGCGSGILSLAAGHLRAREVLGLDTDPIAVEATLANARRNGLGGMIEARRGSLPSRGGGGFDLVLANLIASVVVELAPLLATELRPGGRLLVSGVIADREPEVRRALEAANLVFGERLAEGDWNSLVARRRGKESGERLG